MKRIIVGFGSLIALASCVRPPAPPPRVPAMEYANRIRQMYGQTVNQGSVRAAAPAGFESAHVRAMAPVVAPANQIDSRASLRMVEGGAQEAPAPAAQNAPITNPDIVSNLGASAPPNTNGGYQVYESSMPNARDYNGPLSLGDPGLSASLWKEGRAGNSLFRDYRAFQPMDLITIVVTENSEGKKEADTDIKSKSTVNATIEALLGLTTEVTDANPNISFNPAIAASTQNDFKGEGETTRKGSLKARISAMVVDVLPSQILVIEGEKITSVNNEDEEMVISGLVRPEDVNSNNEVDSSKIANLRVDYYGKGTVGEVNRGGWLARIMRTLWPF